jgi:hypothetical protein
MKLDNKSPDHYKFARTRLNEGDQIRVVYVGTDVANFGANNLKRLFGWVQNEEFIGTVADGYVKFLNLKGAHQCRHCVYNVEILIAQERLKMTSIKKGISQSSLW